MFERLSDSAGGTVLLVDDDPEVLTLCRRLLARDGWQVHVATDGAAALELARRQCPDVFVMDVMMPGMDGCAATRALRADTLTCNTPVVMLSAHGDADSVIRGLEAGADEYLVKPIRPREFVLRMRAMGRLRRAWRELEQSYERLGVQSWALNCLLDFTLALSRVDSVEAIYDEIMAMAATMTACRHVAVAVEDGSSSLRLARSTKRDDLTADRLDMSGTLCGEVMRTGRAKLFDAAPQPHEATYADATLLAPPPAVAIPIRSPERAIGVIYAADRVGRRPFTAQEIELLELAASHAATAIQMVQTRQARDSARDAIVIGLARLAEHRDDDTGRHLDRVAGYCMTIAQALRRDPPYSRIIDNEFIGHLQRAAPLHDIGKVAIPDAILLKPAPLTPEESRVMQMHTTMGTETIRSLLAQTPDSGFLRMAEQITHCHHEWFDGTGYPRGLRGEEIPLSARIIAIADSYDAMRAERTYKQPMTHGQAVRNILEGSGTQFDPLVVEAFLQCETEIERVASECSDDAASSGRNRPAHVRSAAGAIGA